MTTFTQDPWDSAYESTPPDAEDARLGASKIRNLKRDIRERIAVDHYAAGTSDDGAHKKVTLLEQATDPTTAPNVGFVYSKDVSGVTELFYKDSAGNLQQLTSLGKLVDNLAAGLTWQPGDIKSVAYAGTPAGWLDCDGAAVSRAGQAALYAKINITWGAGDGTTTFNVPDFRGRGLIGDGLGASNTITAGSFTIGLTYTIVSVGTTDFTTIGASANTVGVIFNATGVGTGTGTASNNLTNRTVGQQKIGEENHLLSIAEMPAHNHDITDPGHVHSLNGGQNGVGSDGYWISADYQSRDTNSATTGITINNKGDSALHNNMQPSAVVHWIIKT